MNEPPGKSPEGLQPDMGKVISAAESFEGRKAKKEAKKKTVAKKNRQQGAKKARAKKAQRKANETAKIEKSNLDAKKKAEINLSTDEKREHVRKLQREFYSLKPDSSRDSELVHTLASKERELELAGHFHIGRTWASFSSEGELRIGPATCIEDAIQLPQKSWEVPCFDDGIGIRAAPVPPPIKIYQKHFLTLDDNHFEEVLAEHEKRESFKEFFSDPASFLEFLSGKAFASEPAYNHPGEKGPKIVEERTALRKFIDSIEMFGLFDADQMYDELHENWSFSGMDLPCPNQLEVEPDRLNLDDPRRFWLNEKSDEELLELRKTFQQMTVEAFAAGMEYQRNLHREEVRAMRRQRGGVIKEGQKIKPHTQALSKIIDLWLQNTEKSSIEDLTSTMLAEFIVNGPVPDELKTIVEKEQSTVRDKAKKREALTGPPKTSEDPGIRLIKNALSSYRRALKKKD
ncbi:hypothetical protein [Roseibacillus persicicus]|uniref:hypothetical protein n=1 Tax=Roseibacillus persicicus TaxID=454148 RepID=UPI00280DA4D4|nr:hypothetical protein [Roseibacillus persicicus]MDQ8191870.1 hypothetical protein [Roseibacillus persicicus]